jgi:hypothetical protein
MRMSDDEAIDEALNKAINDALSKNEINDEEIKKRKPKPFRYLTDENEIKEELAEPEQKTVMRGPDQPNIADDQWFILGLGDMETVENVVRRHEQSRKFRNK